MEGEAVRLRPRTSSGTLNRYDDKANFQDPYLSSADDKRAFQWRTGMRERAHTYLRLRIPDGSCGFRGHSDPYNALFAHVFLWSPKGEHLPGKHVVFRPIAAKNLCRATWNSLLSPLTPCIAERDCGFQRKLESSG